MKNRLVKSIAIACGLSSTLSFFCLSALAWNYAPRVNQLLTEATDLYNRQNYSSAKAQFNAALQLEPNCPDAYNGLGLCCSKERDLERSNECYKAALKINPEFYNSLYNLANNFYLQQNYSEAIALYMRALAVNKKLKDKLDPELLVSIASVYRDRADLQNSTTRAEDLQKALQYYQRAISIDQNIPQAHAMLGKLYLSQRNFNLAEKELQKAISIKSDYSYAYYILGRLYLMKKEYPAALVAYHNSLKYESVAKYKEDTSSEMSQMGVPAEIADHFALGYEAMNSGNWELAESEFDAVAQQEGPFKSVALNNLSYALWREGKNTDSINGFKKAIALSPHGQPEFYYNLGQAYLSVYADTKDKSAAAKALGEAEKAFKFCISESKGNHFLAHNALGMVLKTKGDKNEALTQYNIAIMQSARQLAVVHYNRAILLEEMGRKDEAKKSYESYLKLAPTGLNAAVARDKLAKL